MQRNCNNDDNPAIEPDLNVAEKIIGKWMVADHDGKPALTNKKIVYDFVSATKANVSISSYDNVVEGTPWEIPLAMDCCIVGNTRPMVPMYII
jgi:hypothetical protein